jgi:hypothetical protein
VTLNIGGNDALQRSACQTGIDAPGCPFRANYTKIMEALALALDDDPGAETFQVMEYYNPQTGTGSPLEAFYDVGLLGTDGRIDCARSGADLGLNDLIACIGADAGAEPVDVYPTAKAAGPSFVDGIHPTRAGDAAIACLFAHPDRARVAAPCQVLSLAGRRRQHALAERAVIVSVRTDRAVTVTATVRVRIPGVDIRLAPATLPLAAAERVPVRLRLPAAARRALRAHRRLDAVVKVKAIDEAGRAYRESRTYELVA